MAENAIINLQFQAEKIIYSLQETLKSYKKLRLKGKGTRDYHYLINVPKLYVGEKYCPSNRYSITFGFNKLNNHQLVVIDLDDTKQMKETLSTSNP